MPQGYNKQGLSPDVNTLIEEYPQLHHLSLAWDNLADDTEMLDSMFLESLRLFQLDCESLKTEEGVNTVKRSPSSEMFDSTSSTFFGLNPYTIRLNQALSTTSDDLRHDLTTMRSCDFVVTEVIGEGGMGRVYGGVQTSLNREVALKVSKNGQIDARVRAQVMHEAQVTALIEHPNIMPIHLLAVEEDGQAIQVLKRISGVSWSELLADPNHHHWSKLDTPTGQLDFHLDVLSQVCSAMSYAHQKGVIHRDLKPDNIMVCQFGEVYVLDWGVALVMDAIGQAAEDTPFKAQVIYNFDQLLVGTLAYMSPEMARCDLDNYGPWCDVYLLGATLYEVLCGSKIRENLHTHHTFEKILRGTLPYMPDELSEGYEQLISSALSPNPEDRPQDAKAFREQLIRARHNARAYSELREAHEFTQELRSAAGHEHTMAHLAALYDEAKLHYHTCIALGSMRARVQTELDELHSVWAYKLLQLGELKVAEQILSLRDQPDLTLTEMLTRAMSQDQRNVEEHQELQAWRADEQISYSRQLRMRLATLGLVFFGGGSLTLDVLSRSLVLQLDTQLEFISAVLLSFTFFVTFQTAQRRRVRDQKGNNAIFQRLSQHLTLILLVVSIHRFIGWQTEMSLIQVIHLEMTIIALGSFGMSAISQRHDFVFGGAAFIVASVASVYFPTATTLLYALAMTSLWLGVLLAWSKE